MAKKAVTTSARHTASAKSRSSWLSRLLVFLKALGPGIVTGAADDDPSGIATYSQIGAQFGFAMLWTMLFSYPLMAGIQEISAWIGRVTGVGIAGNIRRHYSAAILYPLVGFLLVANVINLGADLGAMGSALQLVARRSRAAVYGRLWIDFGHRGGGGPLQAVCRVLEMVDAGIVRLRGNRSYS